MKTTIELADGLLRDAKAAAARRGTTLRAVITHALERELYYGNGAADNGFVVGEDGMPHLPSRGARVTRDLVDRLLDEDAA